MSYKLEFNILALREWKKLDTVLQKQFKKKLEERLLKPHVQSSSLRQIPNCYKIKLRNAGYRLVYQVFDDRVVVQVVAIGKRDRNLVYKKASDRL